MNNQHGYGNEQQTEENPAIKSNYPQFEVSLKHIPTGKTFVNYVNANSRWQAIYETYTQIGSGLLQDSEKETDIDCDVKNYSLLTAVEMFRIDDDANIIDRYHTVIKNIYKRQGYYSALAFLLNAGFASRKDLQSANNTLCDILGFTVKVNQDLICEDAHA